MQPQDPHQPPVVPGGPPQPVPTPQVYGPSQAYPTAPGPAIQPHEYEFIVNAGANTKTGPSLPGSNSMVMRILVVCGGLLVLLVAFVIIKGALSGGGNADALLTVAQRQQELIHLTTTAKDIDGVSLNNRAVVINTLLTARSDQKQLFAYVAKTGGKISPKLLSLKISAATDTKLSDASAASTYNEVLDDVLKTQLTAYQSELRAAYTKTTGVNGRKLLSTEYDGASLLLSQIANVNN